MPGGSVPWRERLSAPLFTLLVLRAYRPLLPSPAVPRGGTPVEASFGKTWDATIDAFVDRAVSIAGSHHRVDHPCEAELPASPHLTESLDYADCGKSALGVVIYSLTVN